MTDDLLVATQGGAQRDVRPSSGPPEQPRVGTDALSQHVSGANRTASPGGLESLEALELLGVLDMALLLLSVSAGASDGNDSWPP